MLVDKNFINVFSKRNKRHAVWFMRQAGRYLPEYQAIRRSQKNFLDLCFTPELACEVTLQPLRRFDIDAAILFSDILVVPYALGQQVTFMENEGPKLAPYREDTYHQWEKESFLYALSPVFKALQLIKAHLDPNKALIGFSGAPWTLACYMIEGKTSHQFYQVKEYAYHFPHRFQELLDKLTDFIITYLIAQIENGADVIQIFDTWAGLVPDFKIKSWVIDPLKKIVKEIKERFPSIPIISFPKGIQNILYFINKTKIDGISLDSSISIEWAKEHLQKHCVTQGNIEPFLLKAGGEELDQEIERQKRVFGKKNHIYNLGHGILPQTPIAHIEKFIEIVRKGE